jgi:hypothetical protein
MLISVNENTKILISVKCSVDHYLSVSFETTSEKPETGCIGAYLINFPLHIFGFLGITIHRIMMLLAYILPHENDLKFNVRDIHELYI